MVITGTLQVEKCRKVGIRHAREKSAAREITFKQILRIHPKPV